MADATDNALAQANAQMASVREMVAALEVDYYRLEELRSDLLDVKADEAPDTAVADWLYSVRNDAAHMWQADAEELAELEAAAGDCESEDDARERITCDALSVEVRSDWHAVGDCGAEPTEFRIVLCTGGPHVQIVGELAQGEPSRAWLEYSDWGTGLTERVNQDGDQDALLAYARQFYFGE